MNGNTEGENPSGTIGTRQKADPWGKLESMKVPAASNIHEPIQHLTRWTHHPTPYTYGSPLASVSISFYIVHNSQCSS